MKNPEPEKLSVEIRKESAFATTYNLTVSDCPHSCSRMPSAADTPTGDVALQSQTPVMQNSENVIKEEEVNGNQHLNNNNQTNTDEIEVITEHKDIEIQVVHVNAGGSLPHNDKMLKRETQRSRYHYSREVSFSLLLISIIYVLCVTPFTVYYLLNQAQLVNNPYLAAISRLILQLKFVLNPIVYTRSSTFKNRSRRIWRNLTMGAKDQAISYTPSPNKAALGLRGDSFRGVFGSNTSAQV